MKIKISLLLGIILCFLVTNKVFAQTLSLSGPTTAVTSGALATFTVAGETANKFMGSVPGFADAIINNLLVSGVTCQLWGTDYFADNSVAGKFIYKLVNENTVAKTVELKFRITVVTKAANGSFTIGDQYFSCNVTINPAPLPQNIADLVTYPSKSQPLIGVKLPGETLEAKWNPAKITSSLVDVSIYAGSTLIVKRSSVPNNGSTTFDFSSVTMDNTGDYNRMTFNFSNPFLGSFYYSRFRIVINEVGGNKYGEGGLFCFVNDHPMLWITQFPGDFIGVFPNSFWIFRTVTSGGDGELYVDWLVDRINATNVSIDLYDANGRLVKKLTESTPNNGHYTRPSDASIPRGNPYFYQFKITSIENPSQVGYSEVFHHFID